MRRTSRWARANRDPAMIDAAAIQAVVQRQLAITGVLSDEAARKILKDNAGTFNAYACAKTVNVLEYLFDADKMILVNGEYATRLDRANVLAAETARRSELPETATVFRQDSVIAESNILIMIRDAKDGRRSE